MSDEERTKIAKEAKATGAITASSPMLNAMIAGQRDPHVLADLAHGRMRANSPNYAGR